MATGWLQADAILAVVPVLPALHALVLLVPAALLSLAAAVASLRRPKTARIALRVLWRQRWILLICSLAVILTAYGFARLPRANSRAASEMTTLVDGNWPMHRGGLRRIGALPDGEGPDSGGLVWESRLKGEAFYASPAVVGDAVYAIGSKGNKGRICCFDSRTGQLRWSVAPSGYRATFSSPVIAHEKLVCGEGLHDTRTGRIVCVDLRPGHTGKIAWTFATHSHVECTPVIEGERVYVGAGDDGVYCLDLLNRTKQPIWHAPGDRYPDAETSIVVHEGRVYVGLGIDGEALCVLDAKTGHEIDRLNLRFPVFGPPAIHNGKLYVGMGVGDFVRPTDHPDGQVCCVDMDSLEIDWTFRTGATILGAICATETELVFGCTDGKVYALGYDGKLHAEWNSRSPIVASVAVTPGHIYGINQAGVLFGLDRTRMEPMWEYAFPAAGRFFSSPVAANGHLYVGTGQSGFACVGRSRPSTPFWPGLVGGGCRDGSLLPATPSIEWSFPPSGGEMDAAIVAPVAAVDDRVVAGIAEGQHRGVVCLDSSGTRRWSNPLRNGVWQSAAIFQNRVFVVDGRQHDFERTVRCVDLQTGKKRWQYRVESSASGRFSVGTEGLVVVQDTANSLTRLNREGSVQWEADLGALEHAVWIGRAMIVAAVSEPPALVALDRESGGLLWRVPLQNRPTGMPCIEGNRIYLGTERGLMIRALLDGELVRSPKGDGVQGELCLTANRVFYFSDRGVLRIDDEAGRKMATFDQLDPVPGFLNAGLSLLAAEDDRLLRLGLGPTDHDRHPWFDGHEIGVLTSPMVLVGGRVFVGVKDRGLVCLGDVAGAPANPMAL